MTPKLQKNSRQGHLALLQRLVACLRARMDLNINCECASGASIRMCHLERATLLSHGAAMGYSVPAPSGAHTDYS